MGYLIGGGRLACLLAVASLLPSREEQPCQPRFFAPKLPLNATALNGVRVEDACFSGPGPHHVFVIGDWGGIGNPPEPADHTRMKFAKHRTFVSGVDDQAQQ